LISQGTADIILDACADLWTGNDLEQLTDDVSEEEFGPLPDIFSQLMKWCSIYICCSQFNFEELQLIGPEFKAV